MIYLLTLYGYLRTLFSARETEPQFPNPAVIEIVGHKKHIGRVRQVRGGMIEVLEDDDTVPEGDRVPRRLYGRSAIFQVRPMTPAETRELEEQRRFIARPCAHCGQNKCPRKGTTAEHVHVGLSRAGETWCERWTSTDTQILPPAVAKAAPSQVTCEECRELISTWDGPPGAERGFAVRLIAAFCTLGGHVSVPVGRTERIEEAAEKMRGAGAVLDEAALDLLVHGDPSHVRERYGAVNGFRDLAIQVRGMTGIDWLSEAAEEGV